MPVLKYKEGGIWKPLNTLPSIPETGATIPINESDTTPIEDKINELLSEIRRIESNLASTRNLLDNWDFRNPVNQREITGTVSSAGYFLDRWILVSGTVIVNEGSITLNGSIKQIRDTALNRDVTSSLLLQTGDATIVYNDSTKTTTITSVGGVILAAKVEIGNASTLAMDPPMDYANEILKCQRYFLRYNDPMPAFGSGFTNVGKSTDAYFNADLSIALPTIMRKVPSFSYTLRSKFRLILDDISGGSLTVQSMSITNMSGNLLRMYLEFVKPQGANTQNGDILAMLRVTEPNNICFSAEEI